MSDLRRRLVRLAHSKPELRPHLLPLLKQAGKYGKGVVIATASKATLHTPAGGDRFDLRIDVTGKVSGAGYFLVDYTLLRGGEAAHLSKITPTTKTKLLKKYRTQVAKGEGRRPADTNSPGIRGYQKATNAARSAQKAALQRAQNWVKLLEKSP